MGLFSKKTVICKKCGKEFQIGFLSSREHCSECSEILYQEYLFEKEKERKVLEEKRRFRDEMSGYSSYGQLYLNKEYSEEELKAIELHRDNILEKYRVTDGLSLLELSGTKFIYNSMSD